MRIVWLHGLEGSPYGYKATELRRRGFDLISPDGTGQPLAPRVERASKLLKRSPEAIVVGSSYGGLAAAAIGSERPLAGLLLLAPALHHREPPVDDPDALMIPPTTPTIILHGRGDTVVPIDVSRRLAARCPHVELRELDDGHSLSASLDAIAAALAELCDAFACFADVAARESSEGVVLATPEQSYVMGPGDRVECQTYPSLGGVGMLPMILTLFHADGRRTNMVDFEVDEDQDADDAYATRLALESFVDAVMTRVRG